MIELLLAATLQAEVARYPDAEYQAVTWLERPMIEMPAKALSNDQSGYVVVRCLFERQRATDCVLLEESPGDVGFGVAALRGVATGVAAPDVEGHRVMRFVFRIAPL